MDFAYTYGPLHAVFAIGWAAIAGNTPISVLLLLAIFKIIFVVAMIDYFIQLELPRWVTLLAVFGCITYASIGDVYAHPGERLGLLLALRATVRGRLDVALAWSAMAVGFRPGVGLFAGLALVSWIVVQSPRIDGFRSYVFSILRAISPATLVTLVIGLAYTTLFGVSSYCHTVLPFAARRMYSNIGGSVFTDGLRHFILLNDTSWSKQLSNTTWLQLICLLLIVGTFFFVCRHFLASDPARSIRTRWIVAFNCSFYLVLTALLFVYGGGLAYEYYRPIIWLAAICSLAILGTAFPGVARAFGSLLGVGLSVRIAAALIGLTLWITGQEEQRLPNSIYQMSQLDRDDLDGIANCLPSSQTPVRYFAGMGDTELFRYAGIHCLPNRFWCIRNGLNLPDEVSRIRSDLLAAEYVIVPNGPVTKPYADRDYYVDWLAQRCDVVFRGKRYTLYKVRGS